jgi:hypothetical protein
MTGIGMRVSSGCTGDLLFVTTFTVGAVCLAF